MWTFFQENPALIIVGAPIVLYAMVRIVGLAWFRSKSDFIRRVTSDSDQEKQ